MNFTVPKVLVGLAMCALLAGCPNSGALPHSHWADLPKANTASMDQGRRAVIRAYLISSSASTDITRLMDNRDFPKSGPDFTAALQKAAPDAKLYLAGPTIDATVGEKMSYVRGDLDPHGGIRVPWDLYGMGVEVEVVERTASSIYAKVKLSFAGMMPRGGWNFSSEQLLIVGEQSDVLRLAPDKPIVTCPPGGYPHYTYVIELIDPAGK